MRNARGKNILKLGAKMKFYLKKAIIGLAYLLFSAVTAYAILFIPDLVGLKIALLVLNLSLYCYVLAVTAFQDGQTAYKVRLANDLNRKQIILTGDDIPLDKQNEYKHYKGFVIGLIICIPVIVLIGIHAILMATNSSNQDFGLVASYIYMMVYAFAGLHVKVENLFNVVSPYWNLLAIPVIILVQGVFFYLGGRKIELQQEMIREKHRMIHGE